MADIQTTIGEFLYEQDVKYDVDDFGSQIMEIISKALYSNPIHLIREYVQNSIDSEPKDPIRISIQGRDIYISDNGRGMDADEIEEAKKIGITSKKFGKDIGFRGIGIWSALAIADKLVLTTSVKGEKEKRVLTLDFKNILKSIDPQKNIKEVLDDNVKIEVFAEDVAKHGTTVELREIKSEFIKKLNRNELKEYIRKNLPVPFPEEFKFKSEIDKKLEECVSNFKEYDIDLEGEYLYKYYTNKVVSPGFGTIRDKRGNEIAFYWACLNEEDKAVKEENCDGLIYKIGGFTIGDSSTPIELFKVSKHLAPWFFGEIHIFHPNIVPDASREYFEATQMRDIFIDRAENMVKDLLKDARKRSAKNKADKRINSASDRATQITNEIDLIEDIEGGVRLKVELEDMIKKIEDDKGKCSNSYKGIAENILEIIEKTNQKLNSILDDLKKGKTKEKVKYREEEKPTEKTDEPPKKDTANTKSENIQQLEKELFSISETIDPSFLLSTVLDVVKEKFKISKTMYLEILSELKSILKK